MSVLHGNYIDLIILIAILLYVLEGVKRGFWPLLGDLVSFFGSIFIAFRVYPFASRFLIENFSLPNSFANAIGFVIVAFFSQILLNIAVQSLLEKIPKKIYNAPWTRILAVFPALVDVLILVSIGLTLFIALPLNSKVKSDIESSKLGGYLASKSERLENNLSDVFGGALKDTLNFVTIKPESGESIRLPYKPTRLTVDIEAENRMVEMVNVERAKVNAPPLRLDTTTAKVARTHSFDMWQRQYFAHDDPDGRTPFDRMEKGGVEFTVAGENIALAPTLETAHQGLMNSPGHRRNILDPQFGRIGIGVIDGGVYGKMFTQNFAD